MTALATSRARLPRRTRAGDRTAYGWGGRLRRLAVVVGTGAALALPLGAVAPAPAQAAGQAGYCRDASGVTVVVDFGALGGGVVVRCAPAPLPGSGTGLDALVAAGIPLEGVRRWGDSFICRLGGKPAVTTSLAVTGKPDYHEQCLDTPPAAAFWGYWYASNGGSWQYSQTGVKSHRAIAGGFEGWSFSLNSSGSGNPTPRLVPTRPTVAPSAPATTAAPGAGSAGSGGSAGGGSGPATATAPAAGAPGGPAAAPGAAGTPGTTPTPGPTGTPSASSSPTGTPSASGDGAATAPPPVVSGQLAADETASGSGSSGPSTGTVIGIGALAFLVVAAGGTAWRRRREQS